MNDRLKFCSRTAVASVLGGWLVLSGGSMLQAQEPESPPQPPPTPPPAEGSGEQQPAPQMMPPQAVLDPDEISERELEAAAEIHRKIEKLNEKLRESLAEVDDQELVREKVAEAEKKLEAMAEEIGLSLDKHEQIMQTVGQDDQLRRDFILLVEGEPELAREDLGDDELPQAVEVFVKLQQLNQELRQQMAGIEDREAIQAIIEEAEQSLDDTAEEAGIGLERYEKVMELLRVDLELQEEFMELVEADMPEQAPRQQPPPVPPVE